MSGLWHGRFSHQAPGVRQFNCGRLCSAPSSPGRVALAGGASRGAAGGSRSRDPGSNDARQLRSLRVPGQPDPGRIGRFVSADLRNRLAALRFAVTEENPAVKSASHTFGRGVRAMSAAVGYTALCADLELLAGNGVDRVVAAASDRGGRVPGTPDRPEAEKLWLTESGRVRHGACASCSSCRAPHGFPPESPQNRNRASFAEVTSGLLTLMASLGAVALVYAGPNSQRTLPRLMGGIWTGPVRNLSPRMRRGPTTWQRIVNRRIRMFSGSSTH